MRDLIVYVLLALVYRVESRTFCDDARCVCSNKGNSSQILCYFHPDILEANYTLPSNVSILNLSRNNLTRITNSSLASKTLTELLLVNNQIKEIGVDAFRLPSLETLDLSHNKLEYIHRDAFSLITNLKYLNLASNRFNTFGSLNFYFLNKLRNLILDNNEIGPSLKTHSLFGGGYELTKEIRSISLVNVNLNSENKHVFKNETDNLKNLTLSQNNLTSIIELPENLEYLDVSNNPIENISSSDFLFSTYLRELKLNNILIEEVPDFAFLYLSLLSTLELEGNRRLKKFSPIAWGRVITRDQTDLFVQKLILRSASLTSLNSQLEGIFQKIKQVDLRDNPWRCDCDVSWLKNIQLPSPFDDLRCSTPLYLFNRRVLELNSTDFSCEKATLPPGDYLRTSINILVYCTLLILTVLMMYLFIFSPRPFMYRQLPVEFPRTP